VKEALIGNLKANLKFFKRNRLLLALLVLLIFIPALFSIPGFLMNSTGNRLKSVMFLYSEMSRFAWMIGAGSVLFFISHHLRNRSLKLVFTKPFTPEMWLLAGLGTSAALTLLVFLAVILICEILFLLWNISFQWGLLYMAFYDYSSSVMLIFYMGFLAVIFHPAMAVLFALIFQEGTFLFLKGVLKAAGGDAGGLSALLVKGIKAVVDLVYFVMPTFTPFEEHASKVHGSLRLEPGSFKYLLLSVNYAVVVSAAFFLLSAIFLKRKRLI